MALDYILKTFWWVSDLFDHCILYVTKSYNIAVSLVFLLSFLCTLLSIKSRFIEIDIVTHGNTLGWDEKLE